MIIVIITIFIILFTIDSFIYQSIEMTDLVKDFGLAQNQENIEKLTKVELTISKRSMQLPKPNKAKFSSFTKPYHHYSTYIFRLDLRQTQENL